MYARNDKRRIYQLINMYLSKEITTSKFCNEFYYCYCIDLNHTTLTKIELYYFNELDQVCSRFSEYEEDHKLDPHAFSTEIEVFQKVQQIYYILNKIKHI